MMEIFKKKSSASDDENGKSAIPKIKRPFLIVSPPYSRMSAGITVLYMLCHYLNMAGEQAFIFHFPQPVPQGDGQKNTVTLVNQPEIPLGFQAPLITQPVLDAYYAQGLVPIVIYPEICDNPLNAPFFGRYILHYPGNLSQGYQEKENFSLSYTKILAEYVTEHYPEHPPCSDVLFMPTCDLDFWKLPVENRPRSGSCYYVGKIRNVYGGTNIDFSELGTEILSNKQMSREEMREIFHRCATFYCFEDSAVSLEAKLCGCDVVLVPNKYFSGTGLAIHELSWSENQDANGLAQILRQHIAGIPSVISELALKWQALADQASPTGGLSYQLKTYPVYVGGA